MIKRFEIIAIYEYYDISIIIKKEIFFYYLQRNGKDKNIIYSSHIK